ncbi:FadR/GntR family transcriptional regulator [Amycolatopsis sp. NPDC051903]|uniref:FadR/GntR family transcriptional regulator n=1 Tax=Amycolatopsis sp. NPDC051903 TaxID=3363936 RepID=UPI0037AA21B1
MFTPVTKGRAFESVVAQIEAAIYDGRFKAGDYLPSERALVEQFSVGRSTVREALRILENMGLIKTSPGSHKGPRVSASMTQGISRMLNGAVKVEQISLVDLVQYRMMTGSTANFLAAHLRTQEHLDEMAEAIRLMAGAEPGDTEAFARADAQFHAAIRKAAGNALMDIINDVIEEAIVDLVRDTVDSSTRTGQVRAEFVRTHQEVYDAIERGDAEAAATLSRHSLTAVYGRALSPEDRRRLELLDAAGRAE